MAPVIFRKGNVPCHYFVFLYVDFKKVQCRLSNLRKGRGALSNLRVSGPPEVETTYRRPRVGGARCTGRSPRSAYSAPSARLSSCSRGTPGGGRQARTES